MGKEFLLHTKINNWKRRIKVNIENRLELQQAQQRALQLMHKGYH
jgi:hypothetical protein